LNAFENVNQRGKLEAFATVTDVTHRNDKLKDYLFNL